MSSGAERMRFISESSPESEFELRGRDERVMLLFVLVEFAIGVVMAFADGLTETVNAFEAAVCTTMVELRNMSTKTVVVAIT